MSGLLIRDSHWMRRAAHSTDVSEKRPYQLGGMASPSRRPVSPGKSLVSSTGSLDFAALRSAGASLHSTALGMTRVLNGFFRFLSLFSPASHLVAALRAVFSLCVRTLKPLGLDVAPEQTGH